MFTRTLLLLMILFAAPILSFADEPPSTPYGTTVSRFWWKWNLSRDWSSEDRRATGTLETFSDEESTVPLAVVRLRFYAGLEVAEVARALDRSERSVARDWVYAKTRLCQLLGGP